MEDTLTGRYSDVIMLHIFKIQEEGGGRRVSMDMVSLSFSVSLPFYFPPNKENKDTIEKAREEREICEYTSSLVRFVKRKLHSDLTQISLS